jgi:hypothetical protein
MEQIIEGKKYNTATADLVTSDRYWDGSNFERSGRNTYLYKTKKGNFFLHHFTQWQGERESIEAISEDVARQYYEQLPEYEMSYEEAFGVKVEEA